MPVEYGHFLANVGGKLSNNTGLRNKVDCVRKTPRPRVCTTETRNQP